MFVGGRGFYDDGYRNAPNAAIQLPTLLDEYAFPPPWRVAGVHYAVGPDVQYSAAYLNPAEISGTGITVNTTDKIVTVQVAQLVAPLTFTGYDFSDWKVLLNGTSAGHLVSILHNKFLVGGKAQPPLVMTANAGDLVLRYCDFDGGNVYIGTGNMVACSGNQSSQIIEYNRFRNVTFDAVKFGRNRSFLARFNLIDGTLGATASSHFDGFQMLQTPCPEATFLFNTVSYTGSGAGETGYFNALVRVASLDTDAIFQPDIGFNTIVSKVANAVNGVQVRGNDSIGAIVGPRVHDNYFDWSGPGPGYYPISLEADTSTLVGEVVERNIRMTSGTTIAANSNF